MNHPLARQVFFLSDSTGITAETLGNTLLTQFPHERFDRDTIPFVTSQEQAIEAVAMIDRLADTRPRPIVFSTAVNSEIRAILSRSRGLLIDFFGTHIGGLEATLNSPASGQPGQAHGLGNVARYQSRMAAVEYALEHDDGQSIRALEHAELILLAPSRCGKTPTTMYLALQHGLLAANFPLVEEDFERGMLPPLLLPHLSKCFGLTSDPVRLSQIRSERRRESKYASLRQCRYEVREAEEMYLAKKIPYVNSASMSVEEIAATILQRMHLHH